jgi:hypothetical protein
MKSEIQIKIWHLLDEQSLAEVNNEEGSEVLTAVVTKCSVFWDITWHSQVKVTRCFGGIFSLQLQD